MATSDTTTALFPSPEVFPHELLKEIFSHCDSRTLAAVSGVSFACLELSAPFLYTDIVLRTTTSVVKLFRMKVGLTDHPRPLVQVEPWPIRC